MTLPDEATELYRVPPSEFVRARNDLVGRLRAEGRDAEADEVKALRKPTVIVWALDQLAARDPKGVEALRNAGSELRAAQQATLSGGGADRLREATAARRTVIATLVKTAVAALDEVGSAGRTQADAISSALEAASLDEGAGTQLAAGTLDAVPSEPAGFGDVFGLTAIEGEAGGPTKRAKSAPTSNAKRLHREHDAAVKAERAKREEAERLNHQVSDLRAKIDSLEVARADALAQARANAMEAKRIARELAKVDRSGS